MSRQSFSEDEIAQIKRYAKDSSKEIVEASIKQLCDEAFAKGDKHLHRIMQENAIEREKNWSKVGFDMIGKVIVWAALAFLSLMQIAGMLKGGK